MMIEITLRRLCAAICLTVGSLALSGCVLLPGKFVSIADIANDGGFTFSYTGEMHFVAPSETGNNGSADTPDATFEPQPCKATNGSLRECSTAEIERQMREWEEAQENSGERQQADAEQFRGLLQGFNPFDVEAAEEIIEPLRNQAGWRSVEYKGDGRFDVEFEISGTLDHDFVFPVIEGFPPVQPFVVMSLRKDGSVRVEAPGYSSGASPMAAIMQMMAMRGATAGDGDNDAPRMPVLDGTFVITTRGEILANNTENGPMQSGAGAQLDWKVKSGNAAPTALIRLKR